MISELIHVQVSAVAPRTWWIHVTVGASRFTELCEKWPVTCDSTSPLSTSLTSGEYDILGDLLAYLTDTQTELITPLQLLLAEVMTEKCYFSCGYSCSKMQIKLQQRKL